MDERFERARKKIKEMTDEELIEDMERHGCFREDNIDRINKAIDALIEEIDDASSDEWMAMLVKAENILPDKISGKKRKLNEGTTRNMLKEFLCGLKI